MPQVHTLSIGIRADAKQAAAAIASFNAKLDSIRRTAIAVGSAVAAGFAFKKLWSEFSGTAEHLAKLADASRILGSSLQEAASLEFAAKLSGTNFEALTAATNKMRKSIEAAANAGKPFLGVLDAVKLRSLPLTDQLAAVADHIAAIANPTTRAAAAMEAFGKTGAMLLPFLENGGQAIRNLQDQFTYLTGTLDNSARDAIERATDDLDKLAQSWQAFKIHATIALAPVISQLTDQLIPLLKTIRESASGSGWDLSAIFATAAETVADFGDSLKEVKVNLLALRIAAQEGFNWTSQALFGITQEDIARWKTELQAAEKELHASRFGRAPGQTFRERFEANRTAWAELNAPAPTAGAPSRRAFLEGKANQPATPTPPDKPVEVRLSSDSARLLQSGTVETANELNRMRREQTLAPEMRRLAAETEARNKELRESKETNRHLAKIENNTRNQLQPAALA